MTNPIATWDISLRVDCPECKEYVDLLNAPDFWEGKRGLPAGEWGTPRTTDMEVVCPDCGHEFRVDCEY